MGHMPTMELSRCHIRRHRHLCAMTLVRSTALSVHLYLCKVRILVMVNAIPGSVVIGKISMICHSHRRAHETLPLTKRMHNGRLKN